jgi:WD40 repeat protein
MSVRAFHRRRWLATVSALITCTAISGLARAEPPRIPTQIFSLRPTEPDLPTPVVTAMAIDPRGIWLAVAGDDKLIRILDSGTFEQVALLQGHRDLIRALEFRHDGKILVSGGNDGAIILWDQSEGYKESQRVEQLPALTAVRFSPSGKQLAAVGFDPKVLLFGTAPDRVEMQCDCSDLRACVFDSRGERLAVVGRSGSVHLFNPRTGVLIDKISLHNGRIRACAFSNRDEHLITVGEDGAAVLTDLVRAEVIRRVELLPCKLFTLARIDAKRVAVAGSDNRIRVVDFGSGLVVSHLDGHHGSISNLVFANGFLYSGGFDATLRRWRIEDSGGERVAEKESSSR